MLDVVYAVRFIKEMDSGRNCPWLVEAERDDGEVVEVVMKLGTSECGLGGLVREAYAAMFAADLGLPVAEPFIVEIGPDFVDTLDRDRGERAAGEKYAYGCRFAPKMLALQPDMKLPSAALAEAITALTFDAAIVNSDRLVTKPNCLTDGHRLLLIDHELSLNLQGRGFLMVDPWLPMSLVAMTAAPSQHLFYSISKASAPSQSKLLISETCQAIAELDSSRVQEYFHAIPNEWDRDLISADIRNYLNELILNAQGVRDQVEGILV